MGGISNAQVITEEGKYALDAVQNNPNVEGTLASKIEKLETTSPIVIKTVALHGITIDIRTSAGLYYTEITDFFVENGINATKVISINIENWSNTADIFNIYINSMGIMGFMSPTMQTIGNVNIRVAYLK